jgi:hypothetical protein
MNVNPSSLDFGEHQVGTTSTSLQLTLTNTIQSTMEIRKPEIHGEFSEADDCVSLSPLREEGGTCTITVAFTPREKGLRLGKLEVWNSYNSLPTTIQLSGIGK